MNVLFVASEAYPLVKTGGLGDVMFSLPDAIQEQGENVRLLLPGYRDLLEELSAFRILGWLDVLGADGKVYTTRLLECFHESFNYPLWTVDCPALFDRPGNPYLHPDGYDWLDNAERFTVFARAAAAIARDKLGIGWKADVVHAHDWQTGLVAAFLDEEPNPPRRIFTIHNMAYGGHFSQHEFQRLQLCPYWWSMEGMEFYGGFSMLKAGIVYSEVVTTVSPTYADEICTPAFGYGMDGLLQSRRYKLYGILNGIDDKVWNPQTDTMLAAQYSVESTLTGKRANKQALLEGFGITVTQKKLDAPLFGMVSRLVEQKGVDWIISAIPTMLAETNANFVLIGSGQHHYEQQLRDLAGAYRDRVFVFIGYDEQRAHQLEAGSDIFLMPSRFEPCGLNQLYSLKYGTPPLVFHTGGLADTVVNATEDNREAGTANGFVFYEPSTQALLGTMRWALEQYSDQVRWQQLQHNGMQRDSGWQRSAAQYLALYQHT